MFQNVIPDTLENTILSYLQQQQQPFPEDYFVEEISPEEEVKAILDELLFKVHRRIACRDRYENIREWQNQYALFDLNDIIPEFCIDDELFERLAFRETILISQVDSDTTSKEVEPQPTGGLCLDVQIVEGHQPVTREKPIDAELDREIFQILLRIKKQVERKPSITEDALELELQESLKEYESFLRNEMKRNVKKFTVHLSSQFDVNGYNAGSRITAWVDRYFHTLEEKRTEYIYEPEQQLNEKSLYVALQKQKYYLRATSSLEDSQVRKYYTLPKARDLVCEGANFLLMRYLALMQFTGTFELSTMYINGDMCRNLYECTGPQKGEVNGKTIDICKIYRFIIEECGIEHHSVTVLTVYGRIITQEWEGCGFILNINPLQVITEPPTAYDRLVLTKTWQEDMQLMSKYLDCKTDAERKMKTYLADHPEVKDIIADYVQNILILKPENILSFTMDHFQNLFPCKMARLTYIEDRDKDDNDIPYV